MTFTYRDHRRTVAALSRCRQLRRAMTDAERHLWQRLRGRAVAGAKFRRQHEFGPYVLDFFCPERDLVVEADGGQHYSLDGVASDTRRTEYLAARGLRVLRFSNREILQEIEGVVERIREALEMPSP